MKKILQIAIICCFSSCISANGIPVTMNAKLCDGGASPRTEEEREAAFKMSDVLKNAGVEVNACLAYTNTAAGSVWYEFDRDIKIHAVNVLTSQYVGGWLLGHYPCSEGDENCDPPWWNGRWSQEEALEGVVKKRLVETGYPAEFFYNEWSANSTLGCMGRHPLRYGDVDGDGSNELIVVLHDAIVIFSTKSHKTIFSTMWDVDDWLSREETMEEVYGGEGKPDYPQYASKYLWSTNNGFESAYRGYSKLFVGDFDEDEKSDIVIWRKLYESRLLSDPVQGFVHKGDTFVHYALVDGEYKKQDTEQSTVEGWLTAKQLTWQKGYPNLSECVGQTDKHIPEMIDPLLNDPDVLK